ncbi:MAG TPA: hypothetical protein VGL07_14340 [Buttiauxella sp.]|jgi:hypothetical protein
MNTHNVNTAAPESSGRCDAGQRLTMPQLTDLFLYVMVYSEGQKQPGFFVPQEGGEIHVATCQDSTESGDLAVLTGTLK